MYIMFSFTKPHTKGPEIPHVEKNHFPPLHRAYFFWPDLFYFRLFKVVFAYGAVFAGWFFLYAGKGYS